MVGAVQTACGALGCVSGTAVLASVAMEVYSSAGSISLSSYSRLSRVSFLLASAFLMLAISAAVADAHPQHDVSSSDHIASLHVNHDPLWLADSGANCHMTGDMSLLINVTPHHTTVEGIGGHLVEVTHKGVSIVYTRDNSGAPVDLEMEEVLFSPDLSVNLLSTKKYARETGATVVHSGSQDYIVLGSGQIVDLREKGGLPYFSHRTDVDPYTYSHHHVSEVEQVCLSQALEVWHRRLAHACPKAVSNATGKHSDGQTCDDCCMGKSTHIEHDKLEQRGTDRPFQRVHSDVHGPSDTLSLGGNRYSIIFVCDYTGQKDVYFMKRKSQAVDMMELYLREVVRPSGHEIQFARFDNGGEYIASYFKDLLSENGIEAEYTSAYSPQQNGVAERAWRTLFGRARSMIHESNLPQKFWAEAVKAACYVSNKTPSQALDCMSPYEMRYGKKPNVRELKVFGSIAYAHVEKNTHLRPNARRCIHIGYSFNSPSYKLWDIGHRRQQR
jgi:hypothetical protein